MSAETQSDERAKEQTKTSGRHPVKDRARELGITTDELVRAVLLNTDSKRSAAEELDISESAISWWIKKLKLRTVIKRTTHWEEA